MSPRTSVLWLSRQSAAAGNARAAALTAALLETSEGRSVGGHAGKLLLHNEEWLQMLEMALKSSSPHASRGVELILPSGQEILVDVIVSPTTLMMTLRVIHNVWRFDKQNRNAEEIARGVAFLTSDNGGFVTGSTMSINGGQHMY